MANKLELKNKAIETKIKAYEIIIQKGVNIGYFKSRLQSQNVKYADYLREQKMPYFSVYISSELLTQKEFRFLKKELKDGKSRKIK